MKPETNIALSEEFLIRKIYFIRGHKVMLDEDLAQLYQVETKRLKEQVKRNINRFPEKYMFELTLEEFNSLRSQFATSKSGRGGTRYMPMVFTEHGVLQLSNVLKSERALKVSFLIIDVFVKLRALIIDNSQLRLAIEEIHQKTDQHAQQIEIILNYLDKLLEKPNEPRKVVGFKTTSD